MKRFFWKIFAWFWLTVLVTGIGLAASVVYSSGLVESRWAALAASILPNEAQKAAEAFDTGGRESHFSSSRRLASMTRRSSSVGRNPTLMRLVYNNC